MLEGTAVKEIAELAKAGQAIIELQTVIGEHTFTTRPLHHLPAKPEEEPKPLAQQIPVPNPVELVPFRTFRDVDQPASSFVLRVITGPQIGLFESDGGAWELEAAKRVAAWLTENVPTIPTLR